MRKLMRCYWFMLMCYSSAYGQNPVPNGGFETWVINAPFWEDPTFWESTNYLTSGFNATVVKKDSSTQGGFLAAHMATIGHNNQQILAAMCTGSIIYPATCVGGFPADFPYGRLEGFYKYAPGVNDSCVVFAMLTRWNEAVDQRDTIAVAAFFGDTALSYTFFSTPFHYHMAGVPDSGQVIISTTKKISAPPSGSVLLIDDISFAGTVGIDELPSVPVKIFPNPANEFCRLQIPVTMHASDVEFFDLLGRKIESFHPSTSQELISLKHFPEGIYFYEVLSAEKEVLASGKLMVKH